jgi:hypothetical protein
MMKEFQIGDRVRVSSEGGWKNTCLGIVCGGPEPIETMKGPENFYWVQFDEPQEDVNCPDKYYKAQILSCYINHAI